MIIQNGSVFTEKNTFEPMDILTEGAFISALSPSLKGRPKEEVYDASGCILIPGLVDLHFHGCMGHDLCDHESETLRFIAAYELQHGITAICPATMTLPLEELSPPTLSILSGLTWEVKNFLKLSREIVSIA